MGRRRRRQVDIDYVASTDGDTEPRIEISSNPILDRLVREIGSYDCLDKASLFSLFHDAEDLYDSAIQRLAEHSNYLEIVLANRIAEVMGGLTQGRVIHSLPHSGKKDAVWGKHKHFLCLALAALGRRSADPNDSATFFSDFRALRLVGSVRLSFLKDYAAQGHEYMTLSEELSRRLIRGDHSEEEDIRLAMKELANALATPEEYVPALARLTEDVVARIDAIHSKIFNHHLRLLIKVSNSLTTDSDQILDNFQAGSFGLMRAIRDYVPPFSFIGYASGWIRQAVLGVMRSNSSNIRIPGNVLQEHNVLERARLRLPLESSIDDIAKEAGVDARRARRVYELIAMSHTYSLDRGLTTGGTSAPLKEGSITLSDTLADPDASSDGLDTPTVQITRYLSVLNDSERWVVCNFFGLYDYLPLSIGKGRRVRESAERERLRQSLIAALHRRSCKE